MKKYFLPLLAVTVLSSSLCRSQVELVDPAVGGQGFLLEPTHPTVSLPNRMVRVYPMRKDQLDDQIHSFPLTIISHRLGELFWLMPGDEAGGRWESPAAYDREIETPYYYSVRFDGSLIQTEFTPTARCGYFRFTFPAGQPVVRLANRTDGTLSIPDAGSVSGVEKFNNMQAFFYGEFSAPVQVRAGNGSRHLTVSAPANQKALEFRYGISFISVEQAKKNLQAEISAWDFEKIKTAARERWNEVLGQIQVKGGTPDQRRVFYTALYRCSERMVNITEDGQYYSAFDHQVHQDARPFYVDNWLWDTYTAHWSRCKPC
jgi:predicted alpha-1,2-mannosidase